MQKAEPFPTVVDRAPARARRRTAVRSQVVVWALLACIMLVGGYFRFVGLNWDDFTHLHPDERFLTDVAQGLGRGLNPSEPNEERRQAQIQECIARYPDTGGMGGYFDTLCSTLNPHNANRNHGMYVYGTLPLFMARGAAEIVVSASEWWTHNVMTRLTGDASWASYQGGQWRSYDGIHLVWRFLSALAEMSVILIVFAIGKKLHGLWTGLLAAALYAGVVFSIQLAHFGTADAISNFFAALVIWSAINVQREGRLRDYAWFGLTFGAALASRINLLFMVGLVGLAFLVQVLPALDGRLARGQREKILVKQVLGLIIAGALAFVAFRVGNPYAFNGPGFLGLSLNPRWLQDLVTAQSLVSGASDSPPNYQWVSRASYLFPLNNIVVWGMGIALGVISWFGFGWALWRIIRGQQGALQNLILVAWVAVYFGYMGRQWVMTMRYFIPIYPALVILGAWALVELIRRARQRVEEKGGSRVRLIAAYGLAAGVVAFTLLWAAMFTNIYRHMLTRVQASHWVWERVPGDFAMRVDTGDPDEFVPLINIGLPNNFFGGNENDLLSRVTRFDAAQLSASAVFRAPETGLVHSIFAPHLGDLNDDPEPETLRFRIYDSTETLLAEIVFEQNLTRETHITGDPVEIPLEPPLQVEQGRNYRFEVELLSGGPVVSGGTIFTWEGAWDDPVPTKVCTLPVGITQNDDPPPGLFMDARECSGRDPWFALVNGYTQNIVYEDDESKREHLLLTLINSDYIAISSNRFYDSMRRNPSRWPLTNQYYQWLFGGELGYELVATFQETFELGPLRVSDQHLPTYSGTEWLNEFESEEAFSVYDHPVVFIFRRSEDFDSDRVTEMLYSIPLTRVSDGRVFYNCPEDPALYFCDPTIVNLAWMNSEQADKAPTQLRLTDEMASWQYDNGTWSERFHADSPINTHQGLAVAGWWLAILLFGWAVFPLLFALFPGLADRGYGFAKFMGMFLSAWVTWYIASLRIPVWSQMGIAGTLIALFALGLVIVWPRRAEFATFVRSRWKRLLAIEAITLVAFLAFLVVRLSNPDLWHAGYGGEKPMDFAYFNAVLRSTIFPPYDPWFASGYINYYYFGFVIVGAPVLLLGMIPSIAFNLILPTLFATTGVGAFSVAFSAAFALRERIAGHADQERASKRVRRLANPWTAGLMALVMAVVLGNLDTPRVALTAVARMGGYEQPRGIENFLIQEYIEQRGQEPVGQDLESLYQRAQRPSIADYLRYEVDSASELVRSLADGFGKLLSGQPLYVSPDRWFWGPSRVLAETPGVEGQAITEMPAFTFIYADLHAHMISMPLQLFVAAFLLNELLLAGRDDRRRLARVLALALGAAVVGMLRATNTWDWITYLLLGTAGLAFAWVVGQRYRVEKIFTRRAAIDFVLRVGGFVMFTFVAALPYTTWFRTTYSSIRPWTDGRTPLWAYFDIHGLFLFVIVAFLLWDTGRWFRSTRVGALRGKGGALLIGLLIVLVLLAASFVLATMNYQVTLVVVPLLIWIVALFFRSGQTRPMQFLLALAGTALALTLGVEYVVLEGDIGRQNTVFKFYMQVWLMFSIVGGVGFAVLLRSAAEWRTWLRMVYLLPLGLLIATAAMFPLMAVRGKAEFRQSHDVPLTIDGMEFMRYASHYEADENLLMNHPELAPFPLSEDYAMIRWLQDNVQGTPVIMEGLSSDTQYRWNGRISIYTGLPAVIGWNFHQRQQRGLEPWSRVVEMRNANVNAFYETANIGIAWRMLEFYDVEYLVVGRLERAYYNPEGLAKFETMADAGLLEVVFREGESTIYRVNRGAALVEQG